MGEAEDAVEILLHEPAHFLSLHEVIVHRGRTQTVRPKEDSPLYFFAEAGSSGAGEEDMVIGVAGRRFVSIADTVVLG